MREAFLRAVIANRWDDGPRLVYADWLDEQGESRYAAFIRAQIRRESIEINGYRDNLDYLKVKDEIDDLWGHWPDRTGVKESFRRDLGDGWEIYPWQMGFKGTLPVGIVRRGFLEEIACTWKKFLEIEKTLLAVQPIQKVRFTNLPVLTCLGWQPRSGDQGALYYVGDRPKRSSAWLIGQRSGNLAKTVLTSEGYFPNIEFVFDNWSWQDPNGDPEQFPNGLELEER